MKLIALRMLRQSFIFKVYFFLFYIFHIFSKNAGVFIIICVLLLIHSTSSHNLINHVYLFTSMSLGQIERVLPLDSMNFEVPSRTHMSGKLPSSGIFNKIISNLINFFST